MRHFRRAFSAILVLAGLCLHATAAPAQYFGAIGYSPITGAMGWGFDYPTAEAAARTALARCAQHARDCQVAVLFKDGCGVVAGGDEGHAGAASPSRSDAERLALRRCDKRSSGCQVLRWVCTTRSMY